MKVKGTKTLAAMICSMCDQDLKYFEPCYFWPIGNPFIKEPETFLLCQNCFAKTLEQDCKEGEMQ